MVIRRLKTYTSESGNVYEYYFVGKRPALPDEALGPATEFIFDVRFSSQPTLALSIFLREEIIERWQSQNGRNLLEPEQYALAKMKLFQAFDETENLGEAGRKLTLQAEELEYFLLELGIG